MKGSAVPARWDHAARGVELEDSIRKGCWAPLPGFLVCQSEQKLGEALLRLKPNAA